MKRTETETTTQTLTRLIRALDRRHPITITYTKADGSETIRTIEIFDITLSAAGDILIKAMDRQSGEQRTFRLDRIRSYTVHRTAYVVPATVRAAADRPAVSLATVTVLHPADATPAARIDQLAAALAA